jgi:tetratricopeptide (TPR) repeat protein
MTFTGLDGDVAVGLSAKNMIGRQEEVNATAAVTAEFDNFRIHRVDELVWKAGPARPSDATTGCDQAPHYLWKGKLAQDEGEALELFLKATAICPGFIRPYELAGDLYRKQGKTEEAVACFEKAAELGSVNAKLYYQLARLLFEQGGMDDASRHLDRSLRIRPDYPPAMELKREMERVVDGEGPTIVLYEPAVRRGVTLIHARENLTVRGLVTDQSGVAWVEVNGERTALDDDGHFLRDIPILTGENHILVDAEDIRGNLKRLSVAVRGEFHPLSKLSGVDTPSLASGLYGRSYAVVIGVDRYEKWPPLEFAASDATAVKEALERSGFDDITLILNEEATQRRILTELFETLPRKAGVNDRVVFYFAGHGQTEDLPEDGKRGYIIPVDAGMSDYPATAVSMDQIRTLSSRIRAKHIFYVMDSCYSGLGFNRSAGVSPRISDYLRKISSMRVVQVITAGGKGEQVQEQGGHGLFTAFFLKALEGEADLDKDNVVTGTELGAYLRPAVSNASNQAQTPLYGRLEGEGEFLFFVQRPGDGG